VIECGCPTGIVDCCASTVIGHTAAAPPRSVMNSRRFICPRQAAIYAGLKALHHCDPNVRFGSLADIRRHDRVCSTTNLSNTLRYISPIAADRSPLAHQLGSFPASALLC
jgi:hypothetical protein